MIGRGTALLGKDLLVLLRSRALLVLHEGRAVHAGTVEEFAALAGSGEDDFEAAFVRFLDRVADGAPHA